jgi:hypothetical protein
MFRWRRVVLGGAACRRGRGMAPVAALRPGMAELTLAQWQDVR